MEARSKLPSVRLAGSDSRRNAAAVDSCHRLGSSVPSRRQGAVSPSLGFVECSGVEIRSDVD
uniref:Uncharacterized protein n=1 Tax=Arundo donax TaxID=35708 RepID=A0A0A9G8B6_ARUDO